MHSFKNLNKAAIWQSEKQIQLEASTQVQTMKKAKRLRSMKIEILDAAEFCAFRNFVLGSNLNIWLEALYLYWRYTNDHTRWV